MKETYGEELITKLDSVDWKAWFKGQGLPPVISQFDQTLAIACKSLAARWTSDSAGTSVFSPADIEDFTPTQKSTYLD
jgi:leukotriene-A4 hydrolase